LNLLNFSFKNTLRERIFAAFVSLLCLFALLFLVVFGWLEWQSHRQLLVEKGVSQAKAVSDATALALYTENVWLLNARMEALLPLSDNLVLIYKKDGSLWQAYGDREQVKSFQVGQEEAAALLKKMTGGSKSEFRQEKGCLVFFMPVSIQDMAESLLLGQESMKNIGVLQLVMRDDTHAHIKKLLVVAGGVLFVLLLLAALVIHKLALLLSNPITFLTQQALLAQKEHNFRFHVYGTQEIQELVHAFNSLISARNQAEQEVRSTKERLEAMMDSMSDLVYIVDGHYRILYANAATERLFGPDAVGRICCEYLNAANEPPCAECPNVRILETLQKISWSAKRGDRLFEISSLAMELPDGATGVMHVARDVTDTRQLEEERIKAQRLESIGMLAAGIAHDFNNVLMAILGNVSLAKMFLSPGSKSYERLEHAEKACDKAKALANQLLAFAKGGAPVKRLLNIGNLVKECVEFSSHGKHVKIEFHIPADVWQAEVDEGQISQVINNLVVNAIQAMPNGGVIQTSVQNVELPSFNPLELPAGPYVHISVRDTGPGIAPEILPKIFDPFFTTKPMGSGLGLATSYTIVKRHKGRITVESELGKGSVFHIYLPAAPQEEIKHAPQNVSMDEGFSVNPNTRVLVMDDEDMVFEILEGMLKVLGLTAHRARDGEEAIQAYKEMLANGERYYAVLLDLTISGGMGGKDALAVLRTLDSNVRAIACSGYAHDPVMTDPVSHGFVAALAKPVDMAGLKQVLLKLTQCNE